jgi:DNA-binding response OmpR family regulator
MDNTSPMNILVVEDDPVYASFVADTLRTAGHHVLIAKDGASARAQVNLVPDAVILDLNLPDESGYDLARSLRRNLPATSIVILLTAELNPHRDTAEAVGIDIVLTKPVEEALVTGIVDHMRAHRERRLRR